VVNDRIRPAKLADAIAGHLESLILEGSLRPGDRLLAERDLAQKLDVSRPSLREALNLLEQRGLLISGRGGAVVAPLLGETFSVPLAELLGSRPDAAYEYLEFRGFVEGLAAYFAALRASDIDREMVHMRFAAMEQAHDNPVASIEADTDATFHQAVYEASHNVMLLHVMSSLSGISCGLHAGCAPRDR
jgi:GntR family transcriptional repressor for pyruvate dehydrogenase complex